MSPDLRDALDELSDWARPLVDFELIRLREQVEEQKEAYDLMSKINWSEGDSLELVKLEKENQQLKDQLSKYREVGWLITYSDGSKEFVSGVLTDDYQLMEGDEAVPVYELKDEDNGGD